MNVVAFVDNCGAGEKTAGLGFKLRHALPAGRNEVGGVTDKMAGIGDAPDEAIAFTRSAPASPPPGSKAGWVTETWPALMPGPALPALRRRPLRR